MAATTCIHGNPERVMILLSNTATSAFAAHAVRDGNVITGQHQHSGGAAARLVIEALGQ